MSEREAGVALVITTLPDAEAAERVARTLVEERRIACANLLPGLLSLYRWRGAVQREGEVMVLMKVPGEGVDALFGRLREIHPYEVPEMVALSVDAVSEAYHRWVRQETIEVTT